MRVDAHQHFWKYNPAQDSWRTEQMAALKRDFLPCHLLPELAAQGVQASVAVQAEQSEAETLFLLDLAAEHPVVAGVVGWVDLCSPQLPERLKYFSQFEKLCGFRHLVQSEPDDNFLLREDFTRGIAWLSRFDFTYDLLIYPRQLGAALRLVETFPQQRFVIDHLAKPAIRRREMAPWSSDIRAVARHPNVYCKLSGLITEADWEGWRPEQFRPYLEVASEAFGVDRLMFGSDWPVCLLAGSYQRVLELLEGYTQDLSRSDRDKIFGSNAAQFYGLRAFGHGLTAGR
jgi:L-fuconolactonase